MNNDNTTEKVLKLIFDNRQFENNLKTSVKSIDKLDKSLNKISKDGAEVSLNKKFETFTNRTLSDMSRNMSTLTSKFSTLGLIGQNVIGRLTNKTIGLVENFAKLAVNPIINGGKTRAFNLEQANFQLQGLLNNTKKVNDIMENVKASVEGTAYSLDDAAKVASQFAATGLRAGAEMEGALKGVSGVAAMTGSDYQIIGQIFTKVAGNGRLMGDELLQLSSHGLNAAASLASYMNKYSKSTKVTEQDVRKMVSKGQISFKLFSAAMDDSFGEHAKKANDTFTGALGNIKAALARIGADFFSPIIKNKGTLVKAMSTIMKKIDEFHEVTKPVANLFTSTFNTTVKYFNNLIKNINVTKSLFASFSNMLADEKRGPIVIKMLSDSFIDLLKSIGKIKEIVSSAWYEVFPKTNNLNILYSILGLFIKITHALELNKKQAQSLKTIFTALFSALSLFKSLVFGIASAFSSSNESSDSFLTTVLDLFSKVSKLIIAFDKFNKRTRIIESTVYLLAYAIKYLIKNVSTLVDKNLFDAMSNALHASIRIFRNASTNIKYFISTIKELKKPIDEIANTVKSHEKEIKKDSVIIKMVHNLVKIIHRLGYIIKSFFRNTGNEIANSSLFDLFRWIASGSIILIFRSFSKSFDKIASSFAGINKMVNNVTSILSSVKNVLAEYQKQIKANVLSTIAKSILMIAASLLILALIPEENLTIAIEGLAATCVALVLAMKMLIKETNGIQGNVKQVAKISSMMISISASIILLSIALKMISSLNLFKMVQSILGISALMVAMTLTLKLMNDLTNGKKVKSAAMVIAIGLSIYLMAKSMEKIASIPTDKIIASVLAISALLLAMSVTISQAAKMKGGISKIGIFLSLTLMFTLISFSLKKVSEIDNDKIKTSVVAMSSILLIMATSLRIISDKSKFSASFEIIAMVLLMYKLGTTLQSLSTIKSEDITKSLTAIGVILAMLVVTFGMMTTIAGNLSGRKIAKIAGSITTMAGVLVIISEELIALSSIPYSTVIASAASISVLLVALTMMMGSTVKLVKNTKIHELAFATGIIFSLAGVVAAISASLMIMKSLSPAQAISAAIAVTIVTAAVTEIFKGLTTFYASANAMKYVNSAVALLVLDDLAIVILGIGFALSLVKGMNVSELGAAALSIVGVLGLVSLIFVALTKVPLNIMGVVKAIAVISLVTVAVIGIATALRIAKGAGLETMGAMIGTLAVGIVAFAAACVAVALVPWPILAGAVVVLGAMSLQLLAFGAAAALFGLGVREIGQGIGEIGKGLAAFVKEIVPIMDPLAGLIKYFVDLILDGMNKIAANVGPFINDLLNGIEDNAEDIGESGGNIVTDFIDGMIETIPQVVTAGVRLVIAVMHGIEEYLPKLIAEGLYMMAALLDGLIQGLLDPKFLEKLDRAVKNLGVLLNKTVRGLLETVGDLGGQIIEGLIVGIAHALPNLGTHIKNACEQIKTEFCEYWGIASPSKKAAGFGENIMEGLANGINDKVKLPTSSMGDAGNSLADAFTGNFTDEMESGDKKRKKTLRNSYTSINETQSKEEEKLFAKYDKREDKREAKRKAKIKKQLKAKAEETRAAQRLTKEQLEQERIEAEARRRINDKLKDDLKKIQEDGALDEEEILKKQNETRRQFARDYNKILSSEIEATNEYYKKMDKAHKGGSKKYLDELADRYGGQNREEQSRQDAYKNDKNYKGKTKYEDVSPKKNKKKKGKGKSGNKTNNAALVSEALNSSAISSSSSKSSSKSNIDEKIITTPTKRQLISIGSAYNSYIAFGINKNVSSIKKSTSNALKSGATIVKEVQKDLLKGGSVFSEFLDKSTQDNSKKRVKELKKERSELQAQLKQANKKDNQNRKEDVKSLKKQLDANSKNLKNAQRGNAITLKQSAETFIAYRDTVKKSLEDVTKSFEALDLGEIMATKDIMSNLDSQSKGINKWLNALKVARDKGVNKDLISKWTKEGVSSYKEVGAVVGMTSKQVMNLNSKWERNQRVVKNASDIATMNLVKVGKTTKNAVKGMTDMVNFNGKTYALAYKDSQKVIEQLHKINTWTIDQDIKSVRNSMTYGQASFNMLLKKYGKDKEKLGIKSAKKFLNTLKVAAEKEGKILYKAAHPDEAKAYEKSIKQAKNYYERMLKKHGEFNEKTKAAKEAYLAQEREYNEKVAELYEETYSKIADNIKSYLSFSNISGANPISDFFTKVSDNSYDEYQKKKDEMEKLKSEMDKAYKEYEDASKNTNTVAQRLKASELSQVYEKAKEKYESAKDEFDGMEEISAKKFAENLKGRNDAYEEFGNQLDLLRNLGYSEDVIKYVEEQGYEAGRSYASALIAGSADKKAVNDEMKRTKKYAADKMIQESRQRMQNIKKFTENYQKLIAQGFQPELLAEYAQLGVDEANEAFSTMLEMDSDQKHQYQSNFQQSLEIPKTTITAIQNSWTNALNPSLGKAVDNIKVKSDDVKEAADTIGDALSNAVRDNPNIAKDLGKIIGDQVNDAVKRALNNDEGNSKQNKKVALATNIENKILKPIVSALKAKGKEIDLGNTFKTLGENIIKGMTEGIEGKKGEENPVIKAMVKLVKDLVKKPKKMTKTHSPSRVFREIGTFFTEGLAIGITDKAKMATDAMSNIIRSVMNAADSAEITASPTISPVLDMDNMNTVSDLGDMAYSISSDLDKMSTLYANIEEARRYRLKVTNSLDEITKKMDNLDSSQIVTNNINMSVDGSKGAIATADEISRTLQTQVERRVAVWA